jgi:acetyltransferase-like isoleucine patch superfamily enzyme
MCEKKQSGLNQIYPGVVIGDNTIIEMPCIVGKPSRGGIPGEFDTRIGKNSVIRPFTSIYFNNIIGDDFQTGQGVSIREANTIGNNVSIGTNATLEFGNKIGNNSRVHSGCFLEMVTIGEDCFIGPNVVFTDDPHPMNCPRYKDCLGGAIVKDRAKIGANSTILPGIVIGKDSLVGAGSVVCRNVPDGAVVAGNPAKIINRIENLKCTKNYFTRPYLWPPYEK